MTRAILFGSLATLFLGACLMMSPGIADAAKPCKASCKTKIAACKTAVNSTASACLTAAGTDKAAKKACKKWRAQAKKACKKGGPDSTFPTGCDPATEPCSPSGAFLDGFSSL